MTIARRGGRRGLINTALCCILALPCAFGLWSFAERSTIVPACSAYAREHGMSYSDFQLNGVKHASTVVCLLTRPDGRVEDVYLRDLVSFVTDTWVSFAMSLEITVPGFVILLAVARVAWDRRAGRTAA